MRGTQSFVGVMTAVWKRPSLTALEIAWRWSFGLLALGCLWLFARGTVIVWVLKVRNVVPILLRGHLVLRGTTDVLANAWLLAGAMVAWSILAGIGRGAVLRRWDRGLRARRGSMIGIAALRALAFAALLVLWFAILVRTARVCVWTPMDHGRAPSYVPGFAIVVTVTLLLFVLWAAVSWVLRIAPVLAMARDLNPFASVGAATRLGPLRSKLVEINLVMGIVKVALVVLAMVFSACPLPFQSVESQTFLIWWWIGVGVLYVVASDYFHAVRAAAYESMYRVYQPAAVDGRG